MGQEICLIIGQVSLSLFHEKKKLQMDICGRGWDWQQRSQHPGQIILWPELWKEMGKYAKLKENRNGHIKNETR